MTKKWSVRYDSGSRYFAREHWTARAPDGRRFIFPGTQQGWHDALALANMEASYEMMEPSA